MKNSRDHILDTSVNLFLRKSYREVTMSDIVSASGMSKGAFYHYFSSKEKVFEEVVNHFFLESRQGDITALSQASLWSFCQDYVGMIIDRVNYYNDTTGDTDGLLRANQLMLIADATRLFPEFQKTQQLRQQQELSAWEHIISKAQQTGEIHATLDVKQVAKLFVYLNYGIGVYYLLRVQLAEFTAEVTRNFQTLYQTLKA